MARIGGPPPFRRPRSSGARGREQPGGGEGGSPALRAAHAGLADVLGDGLVDGGGQGQVEEAVGLGPLVEGVHVAVEACVGGRIVVLASHVGVAGKELLQPGLLLGGGLGNRDARLVLRALRLRAYRQGGLAPKPAWEALSHLSCGCPEARLRPQEPLTREKAAGHSTGCRPFRGGGCVGLRAAGGQGSQAGRRCPWPCRPPVTRHQAYEEVGKGVGGFGEGCWVGRRQGAGGAPADTLEATDFEERLALPADVSHGEARAGVAHDVCVFGQKAISEQPPAGRAWLWRGQEGTEAAGQRGTGLPQGGVDLLLGQVALWQRKQAALGAEDTPYSASRESWAPFCSCAHPLTLTVS